MYFIKIYSIFNHWWMNLAFWSYESNGVWVESDGSLFIPTANSFYPETCRSTVPSCHISFFLEVLECILFGLLICCHIYKWVFISPWKINTWNFQNSNVRWVWGVVELFLIFMQSNESFGPSKHWIEVLGHPNAILIINNNARKILFI